MYINRVQEKSNSSHNYMTKLFEHVCFDEWEWDERNFTVQLREGKF